MITLGGHVIFCITNKENAFQYFTQSACFTIHIFLPNASSRLLLLLFFHNCFVFVDLRISRIENNGNVLTFRLQTYCGRVLIR